MSSCFRYILATSSCIFFSGISFVTIVEFGDVIFQLIKKKYKDWKEKRENQRKIADQSGDPPTNKWAQAAMEIKIHKSWFIRLNLRMFEKSLNYRNLEYQKVYITIIIEGICETNCAKLTFCENKLRVFSSWVLHKDSQANQLCYVYG